MRFDTIMTWCPTLSSILTAIYATLNVAGSIGVFRSNQEYSHPMDRKLFV